MRLPRVLFVSFPHFLKEISVLLKGYVEPVCVDVPTWRRWSLSRRLAAARRVRAVHFYWARMKSAEVAALRLGGRRVIQHFIGTDVLKLLEAPARKRREARLLSRWTAVAAVSQNLVDELQQVGVRARLVPFVSAKAYPEPGEVAWVPGPPWRFLTYVPPDRLEFYGFSRVLSLARRRPGDLFQVLSMSAEDAKGVDLPPNVQLLGWRDDVPQLIAKSHGLLRLTQHDGLPNLVVEALARGRYVVYTGDLPGCHRAAGDADVARAVEHIAGRQGPNGEGMRYVRETLGRDRVREGFLDLYGLGRESGR